MAAAAQGAKSPAELSARVECGRGVRALRGELLLSAGQLCLRSDSQTVFDVPVSSIERIVWHWYSFGAAFEAWINGKSHFISFIPRSPSMTEWYRGLVAGRYWRAVLEGRTPPRRGPVVAQAMLVLFWLIQLFFIAIMAVVFLGVAVDSPDSLLTRIGCTVASIAAAGTFVWLAITGAKSGWRLMRERYPGQV
jgi:hypothetical protein